MSIGYRLSAIGALALCSISAHALTFTTTLTDAGLGLGTGDKINDGSTVDADIVGKLITSSSVGSGSQLFINTLGMAGNSTLAMTVTARTHLDVTSGYPGGDPGDYQAGVLYLSKENKVKDNGLGVRAFTVNKTTALRTFDTGGNGRAKIEGSKEVSGGTQDSTYDASDPNGAPHVDEDVQFTMASDFDLDAGSLEFLLTKMEDGDRVDFWVHTRDGSDYHDTFLGLADDPSFLSIYGASGDKVKKLSSSGFAGISGKEVDWVRIRAVDDDPDHPRGTAEHFLINSIGGVNLVPEPGSLVALGLGVAVLSRRRR